MAESCHHRSRSSCSNQRSHIPVNYSQRNFSNAGELRCTCPHPPVEGFQSRGRANLLLSKPVPHLSQSTSIQPQIRDYPIEPCPAYSQSTHHYSQYFPAHNFHRFRFGYSGQMPRCYPSAAPSLVSQPCYNPPQFHYAQVCHPSYSIRDDEHRVQQVCYLRAYPKRGSELFVAEYLSLDRAYAYPVLLADWVLPSGHPYYSVVFLRTRSDDSLCCDSLNNLCVTTIGGKRRRGQDPESTNRQSAMGTDEYSSACPTCCHYRSMHPCGSRAPSKLQLNTESIRISEAYPEERCTSFSEPLTLENDVYESDSKEDSKQPRRKPYTAEPSSSNESSSSSSSPISSRERSPENSDYTHVHWVTSSDKSGRPTKRQCGEGAVLHELQDLESFFGLRNTKIGGKGNTAAGGKAYSECCSCCYTTKCSSCNVVNSSESTGTTARLICECPECRNLKDYKPPSRSSSASSSSSSSPSLVRTSLLVKPWSSPSCPCVEEYIRYSTNPSHSMVSVPSIHGSTANAMPAMPHESPCNKSCDQYVTAPNGMSSTASQPRQDSRSGGRDYRRATVRDICGPIGSHNVSTATMTALPIYDPNCQQCSEARFADRLCETLDDDCSCTPIIRTSPRGSISLLNSSTPTPLFDYRDTVMDDRNKDNLSNYIAKSRKKGRTIRDSVMRWVRYKSEQCRSRMRNMQQAQKR